MDIRAQNNQYYIQATTLIKSQHGNLELQADITAFNNLTHKLNILAPQYIINHGHDNNSLSSLIHNFFTPYDKIFQELKNLNITPNIYQINALALVLSNFTKQILNLKHYQTEQIKKLNLIYQASQIKDLFSQPKKDAQIILSNFSLEQLEKLYIDLINAKNIMQNPIKDTNTLFSTVGIFLYTSFLTSYIDSNSLYASASKEKIKQHSNYILHFHTNEYKQSEKAQNKDIQTIIDNYQQAIFEVESAILIKKTQA